MTIYKLFKNFSASLDSGASLDIQFNGFINAIVLSAQADMDADLEKYRIELSFLSSSTFNINDARGSLAIIGARASAAGTPASLSQYGINIALSGLNIPVSQGERLYLHAVMTGTADLDATAFTYTTDRSNPTLRRRR